MKADSSIEASDRHKSPYSFGTNLKRLLWSVTQGTLFRFSPKNFHGFRVALLRIFGAKVGKSVRIRPNARVEIPWLVEIGDNCGIGDFAELYSLDRIVIGKYVTISQYAYICTGTHETETLAMRLVTKPVIIEDHAWIAAHAFVGLGVTVGKYSILGAKSSLFKDLPPLSIAAGSPARVIKRRVIDESMMEE